MQLYAFDILALGGEDLRTLPLSLRKTTGSATPRLPKIAESYLIAARPCAVPVQLP